MFSVLCKQFRHSNGLQKCLKNYSTQKFETLSVTVPKPYVYHVELNRPQQVNAVNDLMWREIYKCFEDIQNNPKCRVAILSGAGKLFSAGIDLGNILEFQQQLADVEDVSRKAKLIHNGLRDYQNATTQLEKCNKPVLAAIHSACVGIGVTIAIAADMRYCTKDAWFQVKEALIGLVPDIGTVQRLPRITSESISREWSYTARKVLADEALRAGLVSKVYDTKEDMMKEVLELAEEIADKSPTAIQMIKQNHVYSHDHTIQEGLDYVRLWNQLMIQGEDAAKASIAVATKQTEKVDFDDY